MRKYVPAAATAVIVAVAFVLIPRSSWGGLFWILLGCAITFEFYKTLRSSPGPRKAGEVTFNAIAITAGVILIGAGAHSLLNSS